MPPHAHAVHELAKKRLGKEHIWWGLDGVDPKCGVTDEEYEAMKVVVTEDIDFVIKTIDWNRVLGMAQARHVGIMGGGGDEHHEVGDNVDGYIDSYVCGWCIEHALLYERG